MSAHHLGWSKTVATTRTLCLIDGEAVACGDNGLPAFDRLRYRRQDAAVFLYAFDLIELNGGDLRASRSRLVGPLWHRC